MIVTPSKERLIKENFIEYSFENEDYDFKPNFGIFKKLNSSDQYYLAENFNWDDGIDVLNWIIESPKCDSGTACMIFWKAEPDYYAEYNAETIGESDKEVFDLLQKIISKFKSSGFRKNKLKFNLLENGYSSADFDSEYSIWELPKELKNGTSGIIPISLGRIQAIIWTYQRNRRLKKREKRKRARKKNVT
ncbi:Hypothetical protein I595_3307 [Croceitalea dokdonensis DOKDO 023]|uniref:DUF4274 domain-containing protein n=1 Tax=Croceitalea dokdonensis DOKDO 023 TaxID=1300341 RepID=A0A0P7AYF8_9FLAO|nr:DUF4274 domain-containing protein [Croceitalea dokdonensis]KPM30486.1 Hypothetical protein I595_3307 [Croceitalea dokdonensis DOKDO 023]